MKIEKELKEEIEELKKNAPRTVVLGLMLIKLQTKLKTLQERNAEVKQAIEDEMGLLKITEESFKFELKLLQKLLQKLGLGK